MATPSCSSATRATPRCAIHPRPSPRALARARACASPPPHAHLRTHSQALDIDPYTKIEVKDQEKVENRAEPCFLGNGDGNNSETALRVCSLQGTLLLEASQLFETSVFTVDVPQTTLGQRITYGQQVTHNATARQQAGQAGGQR